MVAAQPRRDRRWLAVVLAAQALYTAGDAIAGGRVLSYYLDRLGASIQGVTLLLVLPEIVAIGGVLSQSLVRRRRDPKRVWIAGAIVARLAGWSLAGLALFGRLPAVVPYVLIGILELAQAISYGALIAWLVQLFPETCWGRVLARRQVAVSLMLAAAPLIGGAAILSRFGDDPTPGEYAAVLAIGHAITAAGLGMYWLLPRATVAASQPMRSLPGLVRRLVGDRAIRRTIAASLHLAVANGLTQSAFFFYAKDHLGVTLSQAMGLRGLMFATQVPVAIVAGGRLDRSSNRRLYAGSIVAAAALVPCWLLADDWRGLVPVYAGWGLFAAVNLSGRSLMLRLCGSGDAAGAATVFRMTAGLLAGLAGLVGGAILSRYSLGGVPLAIACQTLIAVSIAGRLTAPVWLLGWDDPRERP